jgi:hypothetical protein
VGGAAGVGFARASRQEGGGCLKVPCVIVASTLGGALFGYFIGREYDRRYVMQFRGVPRLRPDNITASLEGDPVEIAIADSTVAVAGSIGVQLFRVQRDIVEMGRRAAGVRGIQTIALAPQTEWLTLGSPTGLYVYPPLSGPGAIVREGDVNATVASSRRVFFATDRRIEVAPVNTDTTREWPGATLDSPAHDLALDSARALLWAVTDKELIAFRATGDSLTRVSSAPLEAGARRLALQGNTVAIALGNRGVRLFDISDPTRPRQIATWSVARFVYDVALDRHRLFAAAGPEGVYVIDVGTSEPRTLGLARSLGFASALVSQDGYTYILDRRTNSLRRILSDF